MKRTMGLVLVVAVWTVGGATCIPEPEPTDTARVAGLRGFESPEDLRTYLVEQATRENGGFSPFPLFFLGGAAPPMSPSPTREGDLANSAEDAAGGASSDGYSTTNIQEAGVDESDVVKNDGQNIYVLDGTTIHVVQAAPAESLAEISTVELTTPGDSLYLSGTRLVALSRRYSYYLYDSGPALVQADTPVSDSSLPPIGGDFADGSETTVTVIDVSNPAAPVVEATVKFEGDLAQSRLIGSKLHVIMTTWPRLPDTPTPLAIDAMTLDDWIPDYEVVAADGSVRSGDVVTWQQFFRPEDPESYAITTVVTLDINDPNAPFASTAISANAGVIYASTAALYITDTDYDYDFGSSRTDTIVHKLAFTESGTVYEGSGLVPGRLLNQYSLGEHDGYLRMATTVETFGAGDFSRANAVYVLAASAGALNIVGRVEGIAPNEEIYAARFLGNRGFLVTFERVDPLFTLDLSDPTRPRIVGELKVPGYSDHIQLLDENHLLTVGKDAQEVGDFAWVQGVQLSIFDVTDPAAPTLLHKAVIGGRGTSSEANYNPKAFNYFAPAQAVAFPIELYEGDTTGPEYGQYAFTGLLVYRATVADGFAELGRISSIEGVSQRGCLLGYYGFTRGVFISDNIYAATQRGVKAAPLSAVGTIIGQATFGTAEPPSENCYFEPLDFFLPPGSGLR